jgi:hypothetical protein
MFDVEGLREMSVETFGNCALNVFGPAKTS